MLIKITIKIFLTCRTILKFKPFDLKSFLNENFYAENPNPLYKTIIIENQNFI